MSELPRTNHVPLDAERVEDAFAAFAERVRELDSVANELRSELRALRAERAPAFLDDTEWPVGAGHRRDVAQPERLSSGWADSNELESDWIGAVPPPLRRPTEAPRLALEGAFLVLVALLAGLADLNATWIVIVMASAWALVALSEWAAAAKRAGWRLEEVAAPASAGSVDESTGPWDMPVVHATVVEAPDESESHTVIAKLSVDEPALVDEPASVDESASVDAHAAPDEAVADAILADEAVADEAVADRDGREPDDGDRDAAELPDAETDSARIGAGVGAELDPQAAGVATEPPRRGLRFWRRQPVEQPTDPSEA